MKLLSCILFFILGIVSLSAQDVLFRFVPVSLEINSEQHYTVRPVGADKQKGKILFMFPGTNGRPRNYIRFCDVAAKMGYHVIAVAYPNTESARFFCQLTEDTACYGNFRREVVFGEEGIEDYVVNPSECILTRMKEAIQTIHQKDPDGGWNQFLPGGNIAWSKILLGGHSQGAGHAAYLAKHFSVYRVLMFAGPNDYHTKLNLPAGWLFMHSATPASRYFAFLHQHDSLVPVAEQIQQIEALGIKSPAFRFIPGQSIPAGTQLFISRLDQDSPFSHISLVIDSHTPVDENKSPLYEPVWRWMLGE